MQSTTRRPLAGTAAIEIGSGAASAYCGRLLADAGASVTVAAPSGAAQTDNMIRGNSAAERAFAAYLAADKSVSAAPLDLKSIQRMCRTADIVVIGEDSGFRAADVNPGRASVELTWFGRNGPFKDWNGHDLIIQALTAMPHLAGPVEGPPLYAGDRHSTMIAGVTAYIAALAAILAKPTRHARRFEVSILEANLVLSEMDIHFVERDGIPLKRQGVNRFSPNGTGRHLPLQGRLGRHHRDDARSMEIALRRVADGRGRRRRRPRNAGTAVRASRSRSSRPSSGRFRRCPRRSVPNLGVASAYRSLWSPDAAGIIRHPIFHNGNRWHRSVRPKAQFRVPRTPFGLSKTPTSKMLDATGTRRIAVDTSVRPRPLPWPRVTCRCPASRRGFHHGLGGAPGQPIAGRSRRNSPENRGGPLSRLVARRKLVARIYRGEGVRERERLLRAEPRQDKASVSTLPGRRAGSWRSRLSPRPDAVIENQSAGVMGKLGLGYDDLVGTNPNIVMASMSAFGSGNPWSDTRAYGSTLEQGSGLPNFTGTPDTPPTMAHLAYGDPVGGTVRLRVASYRAGPPAPFRGRPICQRQHGRSPCCNWRRRRCCSIRSIPPSRCAAETGILFLRRTASILAQERIAGSPSPSKTRGRSPASRSVIGRSDWIGDIAFATAESRKQREEEIDAAIAAGRSSRSPIMRPGCSRAIGVAAAPVLHTEEIVREPPPQRGRLLYRPVARNFRPASGRQDSRSQQDGQRLGAHTPAPLLGEHSWAILQRVCGLDRPAYEALRQEGVITFAPTSLRSMASKPDDRSSRFENAQTRPSRRRIHT